MIVIAGAIIAFLIGSGFATGQEILQYFASYGYWGVFGTGLVVLVLMTYVCVEFLQAGQEQQFERPGLIYHYYGGKVLGTFYDYFSIVFIFLSFTVMVAGMGALFKEQYDLPVASGGIGLAVVAVVTVGFGLTRLTDVIGRIGPVIVVLAIGLGLAAVLRNPGGVAEGHAALPSLDLTTASDNWFLAGLSYVGFCMLWLAAFLAAMGRTTRSSKEAAVGGSLGAAAFSVACIVVGLGLLANIDTVAGMEIPMLALARDVSPALASTFSIIIVAGIYTTAVPLLWTVAARFFVDRSPHFRLLAVGLAALGTFIGLLVPFSQMVNVVYVINGYVGILLLVLMLARTVRRVAARRAA
ncbi:hypothetical protein DV701_06935 [Ornithinimicrobium avium]|uniref:Membrane protein YkvI n=1 Tax=Ornithinimicrobium avium TaxID=2283195 RepID=A0A345NSH4_9MICO|nr:hypothetical protein DV701_06935 [Ornithinimicrobium avium]